MNICGDPRVRVVRRVGEDHVEHAGSQAFHRRRRHAAEIRSAPFSRAFSSASAMARTLLSTNVTCPSGAGPGLARTPFAPGPQPRSRTRSPGSNLGDLQRARAPSSKSPVGEHARPRDERAATARRRSWRGTSARAAARGRSPSRALQKRSRRLLAGQLAALAEHLLVPLRQQLVGLVLGQMRSQPALRPGRGTPARACRASVRARRARRRESDRVEPGRQVPQVGQHLDAWRRGPTRRNCVGAGRPGGGPSGSRRCRRAEPRRHRSAACAGEPRTTTTGGRTRALIDSSRASRWNIEQIVGGGKGKWACPVRRAAMPMHDWTRVEAGFHAFHRRWITAISDV